MLQTIITAIGAIICAAIGGAVMFYAQAVLRKEKFKELIYREQFAAYKEIAELAFKVWYNCLHLSLDHKKIKELAADARRLEESIDKNRLFISRAVSDGLGKFTNVVTHTSVDLMTLPEQKLEDLILEDHPTRTVEKSYYGVVNQMREELGIETLTKSLLETYRFGAKVIKE